LDRHADASAQRLWDQMEIIRIVDEIDNTVDAKERGGVPRLPAGGAWKCSGMTFVITHAQGNEMACGHVPEHS
jgi:hypothetical protein